jgi:hypothetical protein
MHEGGVDFIVVGGLAAVLNGAPINAFDLRHSPLAYLRERFEAAWRPGGHHNLLTTCGPLDVLGTIGSGLGYEDLLPHSIEMETGGARVRVLDLQTAPAIFASGALRRSWRI